MITIWKKTKVSATDGFAATHHGAVLGRESAAAAEQAGVDAYKGFLHGSQSERGSRSGPVPPQ